MMNICKTLCERIVNLSHSIKPQIGLSPLYIQDRQKSLHVRFSGLKNNWPKYTMMKDQRKRMTLKEYGPYKLRFNAIRKAHILPAELREVADHEIQTVPVDASLTRIVHRCLITSKPRGNIKPFSLGRHTFRKLADYNLLSGVQRARW